MNETKLSKEYLIISFCSACYTAIVHVVISKINQLTNYIISYLTIPLWVPAFPKWRDSSTKNTPSNRGGLTSHKSGANWIVSSRKLIF